MIEVAWWVKRARWAPYFWDKRVLTCLPSLALYSCKESSSQAARRNSPVSSKSREVTEALGLSNLKS